ncbi:thiosulfate sulfurtransferas-like protein [Bimuria novae-zelandiae CBS 107.79]|uniref:Thiosulfate sulfurtransferas-like protein n=1 Tax=Bimuria novae-zelandiae CBS 107.79 TaxID=1447943 RepID=A0A6A5VFW4_9PLEO|nr:thiosulfate sulfurtransferas-like protein [Bimuria novae-zelandiae CBS 107.79]
MLVTNLRITLRPLPAFRSLGGGRRTMSQYTLSSYIVTPAELDSALKKNVYSKLSTAPRIIPLCASWFLPNDDRSGIDTFKESRIPHARFFDLDEVKDQNSPYPHMLPSAKDFANAMGRLGIHKDDSVVVYDSKELGIFSAPRVAWTLKIFGHPNVHILNNFKIWCRDGFPTESGEPKEVERVDYPVSELDKSKVAAFEEVKEIVKELGKEGAEEVQVLDARPAGRWAGTDPEPREGLSSGHMPQSINVAMSYLLHPEDKTLLPAAELKQILQKLGVDPSKPVISSCGTGVTAAIIDTALTEAGYPKENRRIYDGSWTEWAQRVQPTEGLIRKSL